MKPGLCLGTAQFGLPYGITNAIGRVHEAEVVKILAQLEGMGFCWIDTAQAYGNAEEVVGRNLPIGHQLRLITKLPSNPQATFTAQDALGWENIFRLSCERLGVDSVDSLLLHAPADLSKPGSAYLEDWLLGLRQRGLVRRLGVSIYGADDLEGVSSDLLDLVQLPLSLFDQRLLQNGTVARLHSQGSSLHVRSIYLQGLLLTPSQQWPDWMSDEARAHQQALEDFALQRDCSLIDLALGFAQAQTEIEAVVIGFCSVQELAQCRAAWLTASPWHDLEWQSWGLPDCSILDPRRWPR